MSLGKIIKQPTSTITKVLKGSLSEINVADTILAENKNLTGVIDYIYSDNFIHLIDEALLNNTFQGLSIEQERFLSRFLKEANKVMSSMNMEDEDIDPYKDMSINMKQLDETLGSYTRSVM